MLYSCAGFRLLRNLGFTWQIIALTEVDGAQK